MSRRSSGHKPTLGLKSPTSPGATSVWVGARPSPASPHDHALAIGVPRDSNPRRLSSTGSEGQYFVVSVRNSSSDSEPSSGKRNSSSGSTSVAHPSNGVVRSDSSAIPPSSTTSFSTHSSDGVGRSSDAIPPASGSTSFTYPSNGVGQYTTNTSSSSSSGPFSPTSPPFGSLQFQPNVYLHGTTLAGNTSNLLGNPGGGGNVLSSTGNLYNGGSFLPAAASSMAALPQGGYDPGGAFMLQQQAPLSPDLLAASLGQTLSLSHGPTAALYAALPQPQPSLMIPPLSPQPYLGPSLDLLSAAMWANQVLQSPTSPVFSLLGAAPGFSPTLPGAPPVNQSSFGVSSPSPPPPVLGDPPSYTSGSAKRESLTSGQRRSLSASCSLEQGDDQTTSGVGSSVPSSPSDSFPASPHTDLHPLTSGDEGRVQGVAVAMVDPCYDRPLDREACIRCGKKVYAMEKLGPVKDVLYHKTCFTCIVCHTTLSLSNFHHNHADMADLNVYCGSHKPLAKANPLDSNAVGIHRALSVPKTNRVNDQIRGGPEACKNIHLDSHSVSIRAAMHVPATDLQTSIKQREGAWFREERKSQAMPPRNVVRHGSQDREYEGSRSLYINPT